MSIITNQPTEPQVNKFRSPAINTITRKRLYQFYQEGRTPESDALLQDNELCVYACYLAAPQQYKIFFTQGDGSVVPFPAGAKPINYPSTKEARLDQLAQAASLISREMDRLESSADLY
jgi:hypothetical protein